jgi:importin subunit beta-1
MQAGIQLKNALFSKDREIRLEQHKRWLSFPEPDRIVIKQNVSSAAAGFAS